MEKFGIFNLLSALSSLREAENSPPPAEDARQGSGGIFTPQERRKRCESILERHERVARGARKKK